MPIARDGNSCLNFTFLVSGSSLWRDKKTPWVSKPKHLDVFLSNGRGLCRENQCHFQNGFIEDRSYTDPDPLPDCLGGELVVKYNAYIYI